MYEGYIVCYSAKIQPIETLSGQAVLQAFFIGFYYEAVGALFDDICYLSTSRCIQRLCGAFICAERLIMGVSAGP
jgi:hypothetical protein